MGGVPAFSLCRPMRSAPGDPAAAHEPSASQRVGGRNLVPGILYAKAGWKELEGVERKGKGPVTLMWCDFVVRTTRVA